MDDKIARKKVTISLASMESEEIKSLIEEGRFTSQSDVLRTAFRTMLEESPELKVDIAVNFYKKGEASLRRASKLAGMNREEFKEILNRRGIKVEIEKKKDEEEKVKKLREIMNE